MCCTHEPSGHHWPLGNSKICWNTTVRFLMGYWIQEDLPDRTPRGPWNSPSRGLIAKRIDTTELGRPGVVGPGGRSGIPMSECDQVTIQVASCLCLCCRARRSLPHSMFLNSYGCTVITEKDHLTLVPVLGIPPPPAPSTSLVQRLTRTRQSHVPPSGAFNSP